MHCLVIVGGAIALCFDSSDRYLSQEVGYESLINIRPRQNNRSMEIQDTIIRERVAQIIQQLLGGL